MYTLNLNKIEDHIANFTWGSRISKNETVNLIRSFQNYVYL